MGGYNFGFSNNAPPPVPSYGNPTGANTGSFSGGPKGSPFPSYPIFGPSQSQPVGPSANAPAFGSSDFSKMSSGLPGSKGNPDLLKQLTDTYGPAGYSIYQMLSKGLFNPDVASAFLNAMQPGVNRGTASVLQSFGAEGARFGSSAALGLGDYLSGVNLNEQQTLAQMFEQAQTQELNLLGSTLPTLHAEKANKGSWFSDLLGGLEIAGGIIGAPFTGGASLSLVGAGVGTLVGANSGGSSNKGTTPDVKSAFGSLFQNAPIDTGPLTPNPTNYIPDLSKLLTQESAATSLGGSSDTASGSSSDTTMNPELMKMLQDAGIVPFF